MHDSQLEQNHRVFEANHALILEEQKIIRKNLLQEDSDNDQIESSNYLLSYDDKYEIFGQIKEELQIIDEPRIERLNNCGRIFLNDFQVQRKNEFFSNYNEYIDMINYINDEAGTPTIGQLAQGKDSIIKEEASEENDVNPLHEEYEENSHNDLNRTPSSHRRSRDAHNQHSDLKEYLQREDEHQYDDNGEGEHEQEHEHEQFEDQNDMYILHNEAEDHEQELDHQEHEENEDNEQEDHHDQVFDHSTPDRFYDLNRYKNQAKNSADSYQKHTSSDNNSAEKHIEESNINDLLFTGKIV